MKNYSLYLHVYVWNSVYELIYEIKVPHHLTTKENLMIRISHPAFVKS